MDESFRFAVPGAAFMPSYKAGKWDGFIRLFNRKTKQIYRGLLPDIYHILKSRDCGSIEVVGAKHRDNLEAEFREWFAARADRTPLTPTDYQMEAAIACINARRKVILSPTSSGKSFIIFLILSFLLDSGRIKRALFIVPNVMLVNQILNNLKEYCFDGVAARLPVDKIFGDGDDIVVTTWQAIYKIEPHWYDSFDCICYDEVHTAAAKSITGIMESATKTPYRFGMTGTLSDSIANEKVIIGLFGSIHETTTTKELMDRGFVARLKIILKRIDYARLVAKYPSTFSTKHLYKDEIDLILAVKARDTAIINTIVAEDGANVICLYRYIKHGKRFFKKLQELLPDREVYFIDGKTPVNTRTEIQAKIDCSLDEQRGVVLVASFGTLSTGVSIKNLDVGMLISPIKSKISLLQSVGRILRISESKDSARLYDFWDDVSFKKGKSFSRKHAEHRLEKYREVGFALREDEVSL